MLGLAAAALCAALMGFAIQRGGTCLVAAVDEVVSSRRATRLIALGEASLLVAAGMVALTFLGLLEAPPAGFELTGWTVAGGMIMGLGAYVAGACVFGAIARIGNGEPAYLLVPAGFFAGCVAALRLGMSRLPRPSTSHSIVLTQSLLFAGPLLLIVGWRAWHTIDAARRRQFAQYVWSPHVATGVIGLAFVVMLPLVGNWSYTQYLSELASHMGANALLRGVLLAALFGGALTGGWTAGRIKPARPTWNSLARCFAGGFLLGLGGSLVPGTNDGLILLGLPLLYPHAWLALAGMAVAIFATLLIQRRIAAVVAKPKLA